MSELLAIDANKEAGSVNRKLLFRNGQLKFDTKKAILGKRTHGEAGDAGDQSDADAPLVDDHALNPANYRNARMGEAFVDPKHFFELHY